MNCPVCNHSLEARKFQYLPFWACKACRGIWVEAKMLRHIATRLAAEKDIKPSKPFGFHPKTTMPAPKDEPIRLCPKCSAGMKKVNYAYDSNVFIDRCNACDGIWLDKGEIERLAACHQIDERAVMIGRDLIKDQNDSDETNAFLELIILAIFTLARLFFKF